MTDQESILSHVNRHHKDTVFRMLFSDRKNLLSLYNALNERRYENPDDLEIVTLENAIYMSVKNDVAFVLGTEIHLYEHQSSQNPNMPLRFLIYIAAEYQKLIDSKKLYSKVLQKISAPSFIVMYNGTEPMEDHGMMRLSDSFEQDDGEPNLELIVDVYNVNEGHNSRLMEACHILQEYSVFVARIRRYQGTMPIDEAAGRAVDECIEEGILADFLKRNHDEVIGVCLTEFDQQAHDEMRYEEGRAAGFAEGEVTTQIRIAEKMLLKGKDAAEITETTGLSAEQVRELQSQHTF